MNKKVLGIGSILILLIFSLIFPIETTNHFVFGDFIIKKLGFSIATNGDYGLHFSFIISLIMLFVVIVIIIHYKKHLNSKVVLTSIIIILTCLYLYNPILTNVTNFIKSQYKGKNSIEYIARNSNCNYSTNAEKNEIIFNFTLEFINHSNKDKLFYIDLSNSENILKKFIKKHHKIEINDIENNVNTQYYLPPSPEVFIGKQLPYKINVQVKSKINTRDKFAGSISNPIIIIYEK